LSRSNRTLRQANAAYRALRQETQALVRRAETALITAIVLYKLLTELVFLPAMRGIWSLTLRVSPVNYLTNTNAHQIFTAPSILSGIALIAILVALWNLYEFSIVLHGLDRARRGEPSGLPALFRVSLADIRHVLHPKNWPILLYCVLLIPFTDMYVTASYITQLAVPEYILGVIRAKPGILALYGAGILAVVLLTVFFALVLPLFMLERKSFGSAVKESCRCVKQRFCEVLTALARWNIGVLLRTGLLFALAAALLYGIAALVGLESTRAMLLLSRALQLVELPFFGFLLDCRVTVAQCTILGLLYFRMQGRPQPDVPPDHKPARRSGRLLLTALVAGVPRELRRHGLSAQPASGRRPALGGGRCDAPCHLPPRRLLHCPGKHHPRFPVCHPEGRRPHRTGCPDEPGRRGGRDPRHQPEALHRQKRQGVRPDLCGDRNAGRGPLVQRPLCRDAHPLV